MKRESSNKQTSITDKKKRLTAENKNNGKVSPVTATKNSTKRKDKKNIGVKDFPVVAIGASAGGIEAISTLLEHLSPRLGMAYIIIQHLAPDHESILPELL